MLCARVIRGISSMENNAIPVAAASRIAWGEPRGSAKPITTCPLWTSGAGGVARTCSSTSALAKRSARDTRNAPCAWYASFVKPAASPACSSIAMSKPAFTSGATAAGTRDTRVSPGQVSFGTPTLMAGKSIRWLLLFQPGGDAVGDLGSDGLIGKLGVLAHFAGRRMHEEVVDAGTMNDIVRTGLLPGACEGGKLFGVSGRYLRVEISLHDEDRLLDVRHHARGIEREEASEPRRVGLLPELGRHGFPALVGDHRLLD